MFLHHQKVLWIKNFWAVFFSTKGALSSTKGALRRHPDPTYPFLALNQLNRPQKLASGHGQSPINYELRWNCHCNIFAAFDKYLLWNILIFVLYIRIWHGDLNLRYQSKGNHGGEVNVCQEFQLALAGAPDSSYKSSKKKHTPLLATLISALHRYIKLCFSVFSRDFSQFDTKVENFWRGGPHSNPLWFWLVSKGIFGKKMLQKLL